MTDLPREHYSHRFCFKLDHLPARAVDRFSRAILSLALVGALLLILLGMFHFIPNFLTGSVDMDKNMPKVQIVTHPFLSPDVFNGVIVLTGIGILIAVFVKWIRAKKIIFDGQKFTVIHRLGFGRREVFEEQLHHYLGVRLRVRFYQFGLGTRNKFIIELYHEDERKNIPLYITMKRKGIRRIWQHYAEHLHMPGITVSEKGMVSHNFKDLCRPYTEVLEKWHLPKDFAYDMSKPSFIVFKSRQTGEKMIKISKIFWDAFSLLSLATIVLLGSLLAFAVSSHQILLLHLPWFAVWGGYAVLCLIIFHAFACLTIRDVIFMAHDKIYLFRNIFGIRIRIGMIPIRTISGIDINYTPTSDRYYLFIATPTNNYIIGNKMPVSALRWLRAMMINEIIGN